MCCRYVLVQQHAKSLLEKLGVLLETGASLPPSSYNQPPGGRIPAVRSMNQSNPIGYFGASPGSRPSRELSFLHWGLTPAWARDTGSPLVNARAESIAVKPSFRDAFRSRRCLIPASGFYEWKISGRAREPWLFRLRDEQPFAFAGLWEQWLAADGSVHESCAVVTTAPNVLMEPIHHRMPALLATPEAWDAWLDPRLGSPDELAPLLHPFPAADMTAVAVTPRVNGIHHDDAACLAPSAEQQLSMGFA
jgi:putative SOS response-associated peptidase YedK